MKESLNTSSSSVAQAFKVGGGVGKGLRGGWRRREDALQSIREAPYGLPCSVRLIADLDHTKESGTSELKALFTVSGHSLKQNVIDDSTSGHGASLLARMDEAIDTRPVEDLKPLWEYVKSRQTRLRTELECGEQAALDTFLVEQRQARRFILSKGALEAYLPVGCKDKDLEKLIRPIMADIFISYSKNDR